ncbi:MAG: inorganic phosphate transporter [Candidatus Hadarchaeota archaeon]
MVELIEIIVLLVGFFVAWNIGANDAADSIGVSVGARIMKYKKAIIFVVVLAFIGAMLEGGKVGSTVGTGIVKPAPGSTVNPLISVPLATIGALLAAGTWMLFASIKGLPISVTQSMVGSVIGAGLVVTMMVPTLGASVQYGKLGTIGISWVTNPALAALFGYLLFRTVNFALKRVKNLILLNRIFSIIVLVAAAYGAYTLGANDLSTLTGVLNGYGAFGGQTYAVAIFAMAALTLGAFMFSKNVVQTVGSGITGLDPRSAFASQFGAALSVWFFVQLTIPVSSSQALIGSIAGVGLVKGAETVNKKNLGRIGLIWVLTPFVTIGLSFLFGWLLVSAFPGVAA